MENEVTDSKNSRTNSVKPWAASKGRLCTSVLLEIHTTASIYGLKIIHTLKIAVFDWNVEMAEKYNTGENHPLCQMQVLAKPLLLCFSFCHCQNNSNGVNQAQIWSSKCWWSPPRDPKEFPKYLTTLTKNNVKMNSIFCAWAQQCDSHLSAGPRQAASTNPCYQKSTHSRGDAPTQRTSG